MSLRKLNENVSTWMKESLKFASSSIRNLDSSNITTTGTTGTTTTNDEKNEPGEMTNHNNNNTASKITTTTTTTTTTPAAVVGLACSTHRRTSNTMNDDNNKQQQQQQQQQWDDDTITELVEFTLHDLEQDSIFCLSNDKRTIPSFEFKEMVLGEFLGRGEFGMVHSVAEFLFDTNTSRKNDEEPKEGLEPPASIQQQQQPEQPKRSNNSSSSSFTSHLQSLQQQQQDGSDSDYDEQVNEELKEFMIKHPYRNGKPRYAAKQILSNIDEDLKEDAILDLACEAAFLSRIVHPNIVRLRGTVGKPSDELYTIILDRLDQTLDDKINFDWIQQYKKSSTRNLLVRIKKDKISIAALYQERLLAAFDVARGLRYLHNLQLMYRDLKPSNIGLDTRGDMRLFDFGLCKELKIKDLIKQPDEYHASGLTGSRRYMAPEVALCKPYGLSCDVYSFGILLWQIFALKTPFPDLSPSKHTSKVVIGGKRPPSISHMMEPRPKVLHKLMEQCWSANPSDRPTFVTICDTLKGELDAVCGGSETQLTDRSTRLLQASIRSRDCLMDC